MITHISAKNFLEQQKTKGKKAEYGLPAALTAHIPDVSKEPDFLPTHNLLCFCNKEDSLEDIIQNLRYQDEPGRTGGFYIVGIGDLEIKFYEDLRDALIVEGELNESAYNHLLWGAGRKHGLLVTRFLPRFKKLAEYDVNFDPTSIESLFALSKIKGRGKKVYYLELDMPAKKIRARSDSPTSFDHEMFEARDEYHFMKYFCDYIVSKIFMQGITPDYTAILKDSLENLTKERGYAHTRGRDSAIRSIANNPKYFYRECISGAIPGLLSTNDALSIINLIENKRRQELLNLDKITLDNGEGLGTYLFMLQNMMRTYSPRPASIGGMELTADIPAMVHAYHLSYRAASKLLLGTCPNENYPTFSDYVAASIDNLSLKDKILTERLFKIYASWLCAFSLHEEIYINLEKNERSENLYIYSYISPNMLRGGMYIKTEDRDKFWIKETNMTVRDQYTNLEREPFIENIYENKIWNDAAFIEGCDDSILRNAPKNMHIVSDVLQVYRSGIIPYFKGDVLYFAAGASMPDMPAYKKIAKIDPKFK